jgi:hypothetical protein
MRRKNTCNVKPVNRPQRGVWYAPQPATTPATPPMTPTVEASTDEQANAVQPEPQAQVKYPHFRLVG